ncbi:MAG: hypothetical protein QOH43_4321 [Solirubrobacteraceae bacterium]|jgi:hypothetical protein|nr:hypothetical protein [Solirubrobacteraceae bacterium]
MAQGHVSRHRSRESERPRKRCVKGQAVQIKIKASQRAAVASLNATVGGHRTTVRGARLSRPLTVGLAAGRSTVTVKLRLSNGRIVERAYAYRLCG